METMPVGVGGGRVMGVVTSGAYGASTGKTIGMGYLHHGGDDADAGPVPPCLHVEAYGNKWEITILKQPPAPVFTRASQMK